MSDPRRNRRSGVVRLNRGSSSYGTKNSLPLNSVGGSFGSGHPAGGGAGAGLSLVAALLGPSYSPSLYQAAPAPPPSVEGPIGDIGPPPAAPSQPNFGDPPPGTQTVYHPPTFRPPAPTTAFVSPIRSSAPKPVAPKVTYF